MTVICARYADEKDRVHQINAYGHATGSPEACSGISAILYALVGWIRNTPAASGAGSCISMESGDALIAFNDCDGAAACMDMAVIGLAQIAATVGEDIVQMKIVKGDGNHRF